MPNIAIGVVNLVDASGTVVSCADENPLRPATKLQDPDVGDVFRTVDDSGSDPIVVTLESEVALSQFALAIIKHNLQATATYTLVFKNAALSTVLTVTNRDVDADGYWTDKVDTQSRNVALYQRDAALTFKSVEVTISDSTNPDGYFEIARLFLGQLIEPDNGMTAEWNARWVDPSDRDASPGISVIHRPRRKYRQLTGSVVGLTEAEAMDDFLGTIDAIAGRTGDLLVLPERTRPTRLHMRTIWGYQESMDPVVNHFTHYSRQVSFSERI